MYTSREQIWSIQLLLCEQTYNHFISCLIDNKNILLIETECFIQYHVLSYTCSLTTISFYSSRMVEVSGLYECKSDIINKLTFYDWMHVHVWLYIKQSGRISICLWTHRVQAFSYFLSWLMIALQNSGRSLGRRDVIKLPSTTTGESSYNPLNAIKKYE